MTQKDLKSSTDETADQPDLKEVEGGSDADTTPPVTPIDINPKADKKNSGTGKNK